MDDLARVTMPDINQHMVARTCVLLCRGITLFSKMVCHLLRRGFIPFGKLARGSQRTGNVLRQAGYMVVCSALFFSIPLHCIPPPCFPWHLSQMFCSEMRRGCSGNHAASMGYLSIVRVWMPYPLPPTSPRVQKGIFSPHLRFQFPECKGGKV